MTSPSNSLAAKGFTDSEDRLLSADAPLAELHERCGGEIPGVVAVPELLELVRQGRLMGLRLAREFEAFDGEDQVSGFVRVNPLPGEEGGGCEILVENWRRASPQPVDQVHLGARLDEIDRATAELFARLDSEQRVQTVQSDAPDLRKLVIDMRSKYSKGWLEFVTLSGDAHIEPLHWRLLDGCECQVVGSERNWRIRILPLGGISAPQGFELLLIADHPLNPKDLDQEVGSEHDRGNLVGEALTPSLREPIARIIANAETIRTRLAGPLRQEYSDYATDISSAGQHLMSLLDDLGDLELVEAPDFETSKERIDLALRRLRSVDEEAAAERSDMLTARDELGTGAVGFGDHHLTVLVREDNLGRLDEATAACSAALADIGAIAVREDTNLEPAFWAQFPGNEQYVVRRALISSANMASLGSLHGFALGQASGNHWGEAVTLLETTSATPFFFNFHNGDLGNFSVIGPSGSGKTVVMNFLAAQAQKFSPRTVLFDKDRGAELFVRGIGGRYDRITAGRPTGFNPLALPDSAANRAFLRDWFGVLLKAEGPEELAQIATAVDAAYANDAKLRRLRHFKELLAGTRRPEPGDLADRLSAWIEDGEHGWLFDNDEDKLDLGNRVLGFDMTALLENPRLRTPVMMYLFHRIDERLDGEPTMILIDEGWKALDDEVFAARIRDWLKTLRKRNALVGFATQSARDALESRISTALVEQTATMIFMPNSRARAEDYCDGFGLTSHELALIRSLPAHSRCFLIRQNDASVVVRLDLSGAPEVLTMLSGKESAVRRLDLLRETVGDNPADWFPALTGHGWPENAGEAEKGEIAQRLAAE